MTDQKKLEDAFDELEMDDEFAECPVPRCSGEMITRPHLQYWFCDLCGTQERKGDNSDYE